MQNPKQLPQFIGASSPINLSVEAKQASLQQAINEFRGTIQGKDQRTYLLVTDHHPSQQYHELLTEVIDIKLKQIVGLFDWGWDSSNTTFQLGYFNFEQRAGRGIGSQLGQALSTFIAPKTPVHLEVAEDMSDKMLENKIKELLEKQLIATQPGSRLPQCGPETDKRLTQHTIPLYQGSKTPLFGLLRAMHLDLIQCQCKINQGVMKFEFIMQKMLD